MDEQIENVPVLILGNKIDRNTAVSEEQLKYTLGLRTTGKVGLRFYVTFIKFAVFLKGQVPLANLGGSRPTELFMCSVLKKQGYGEGFRWLSQYM